MITLILSIIGFAALFMAIWILHRPLDVHSCPVKWVRITHNVLEWVLNAWAVVIGVKGSDTSVYVLLYMLDRGESEVTGSAAVCAAVHAADLV